MRNNGIIEGKQGKTFIDKNVIIGYAGSVAYESFGIVGMSAVSLRDGLVKLLKKDHYSHGISVTIDDDNGIYLDFHVIISYGVNIATVTENLIDSVKHKIKNFTGMEVKNVNIFVEGIRVID